VTTSLTALRNAAKSAEGESPTAHEIRFEELKEEYIEGAITEIEFDELLDAALEESAPYIAKAIIDDRRSMEVPTPSDIDEEVYQNRGTYFTIDGNIAREREPPEWENVVNVTGSDAPSMDEVKVVEENERELSKEARQKQEELRREVIDG